jgi:hypothetical protein
LNTKHPTSNDGSFDQGSTADIAAAQQQRPAEGNESYAEKLKARLDYLEDWYFHPQKYDTKISQWEVKELRDNRPYLWSDKEPASERRPSKTEGEVENESTFVQGDHCDTYREIAARMTLHYRTPNGSSTLKWDISPRVVSDWKLNKRLPINVPVPPGRVANSRFFSLREWIAWFDRYLWPEWKLDSAQSSPDRVSMHELEEREKREKIEFSQWERQRELGRYIEVTTAGRMAGGEMRQLGEYWRQRNEGELVEASRKKLVELGVTPEVVTIHTDWLRGEHQKITDGIEEKVGTQAARYQDALKQEIARQQK